MLAQSVVHEFKGKVRFVVENYGDSELARRFGITRYPAIFIDDILIAKPDDFGFYGKGKDSGGRYTPWRDSGSHERFRADLRRMLGLVLAGDKETLKQNAQSSISQSIGIAALPEISLKDLTGKPIESEAYQGRVVLVEFWATWCPPCRGTLSWLGKLKQRYGDKIAVVAIAVESEESDVREIVKSLDSPLIWTIGTADTARSFGDISGFPTLFLFDKQGQTKQVQLGAPPDLHTKTEKAIELLLK